MPNIASKNVVKIRTFLIYLIIDQAICKILAETDTAIM